MSKTLSIVLTSVICFILVVLLLFGFFLSFEYGKSNVFHPAISLIQLGSDFGSTTVGTFKIDTRPLDDTELTYDSTIQSNIQKTISKRLGIMYGYYGSKVSISTDGTRINVEIPTTSSYEKTTADSIIENVMIRGVVEILSSTSYSADSVVLSNNAEEKLFNRISTTKYVDNGTEYYVYKVRLTDQGLELMVENFTPSTMSTVGYLFLDESDVSSYFGIYWTSSTSKELTIYSNGQVHPYLLPALINYGAIPVNMHEINIEDNQSSKALGTIVGIVVALLILAVIGLIVFKYGVLGITAAISYMLSVVVVLYFSALVSFTVLNIWAVIGFILGLAVMGYLTIQNFELVQNHLKDGKSLKFAMANAYKKSLWKNLIVNGAALVLGIVMWLIPTMVTVSFGNALVYVAAMSIVCTLGLNFILSRYFIPAFAGKDPKAYGVKE